MKKHERKEGFENPATSKHLNSLFHQVEAFPTATAIRQTRYRESKNKAMECESHLRESDPVGGIRITKALMSLEVPKPMYVTSKMVYTVSAKHQKCHFQALKMQQRWNYMVLYI